MSGNLIDYKYWKKLHKTDNTILMQYKGWSFNPLKVSGLIEIMREHDFRLAGIHETRTKSIYIFERK